jgi:hypothetical protein
MIFPKVTSVPINQLITDSSELTPQESYIFNTVFQKDIQSFKQENDAHNKLQPQTNIVKSTDDSTNYKFLCPEHSTMTKVIISVILTGIIILYTISPLPNMVNSILKINSTVTWASILGLFVFVYFFLVKFIR